MDVELLISERWLWLEISVALAVLVAWMRWLWSRRLARPFPVWLSFLWPYLRLAYALGLPALLLFWRHRLSERFFGLKPLNAGPAVWARDLAWFFLIGLGTWLVLRFLARTAPAPRQHDVTVAVREALYHQVHAAFYREPFALVWGVGLGAWLGLLPLLFETLLDPGQWAAWGQPAKSWALLVRAALILAGMMLYMQTQNLWLILLLDGVLAALIGFPDQTAQASPTSG